MIYLIAEWNGEINRSRYTLHTCESKSAFSAFSAIDRLGDPCCATHIFIEEGDLPNLSKDQKEALDFGETVDDNGLESELKLIWDSFRSNKRRKRKITSRYIKIKHRVWGLIDEHRAIMQDHLGYKLSRHEVVHHINGDKHDNRLENLEVMSLSEHSRMHMKAHPNIRKLTDAEKQHLRELNSGEGAHNASLTNEQAAEILNLKGKMSQRKIAEIYGIKHWTVGKIHRGESYRQQVKS